MKGNFQTGIRNYITETMHSFFSWKDYTFYENLYLSSENLNWNTVIKYCVVNWTSRKICTFASTSQFITYRWKWRLTWISKPWSSTDGAPETTNVKTDRLIRRKVTGGGEGGEIYEEMSRQRSVSRDFPPPMAPAHQSLSSTFFGPHQSIRTLAKLGSFHHFFSQKYISSRLDHQFCKCFSFLSYHPV